MISVIITSMFEADTIGKAISNIAIKEYSGIPDDFEIIQVSYDQETLDAGKLKVEELGISSKYIQIQDPKIGKPYALNLAFKKVRGDIIILTDGDVYFEKNTVSKLLEPFENEKIGLVTGCEYSQYDRSTQFKYYGNLLASSADHNRKSLTIPVENRTYRVTDKKIIPISGRCFAMRNFNLELPKNLLAEDGYMGNKVFSMGHMLSYQPEAIAYAKYPLNHTEHIKQKVRSLGGYPQLAKLGVSAKSKDARKFTDELKYFWFPIAYAKNLKELYWSLLLYPIRLQTWIKIKMEMDKLEKKMGVTGWDRDKSTH